MERANTDKPMTEKLEQPFKDLKINVTSGAPPNTVDPSAKGWQPLTREGGERELIAETLYNLRIAPAVRNWKESLSKEYHYSQADAILAALAGSKHTDDVYVDGFADAMKIKLAHKRGEGYGGWDQPAECTVEHLAELFLKHLRKPDMIDLANFAMMLHFRIEGGEALVRAFKELRAAGQQEHEDQVLLRIRNVLAVIYGGAPMDNLSPQVQALVRHWQNGQQEQPREALDWLTRKVEEGCGAYVFSLTDGGSVGLFKDGVEKALGSGDTAEEALRAALAAAPPPSGRAK